MVGKICQETVAGVQVLWSWAVFQMSLPRWRRIPTCLQSAVLALHPISSLRPWNSGQSHLPTWAEGSPRAWFPVSSLANASLFYISKGSLDAVSHAVEKSGKRSVAIRCDINLSSQHSVGLGKRIESLRSAWAIEEDPIFIQNQQQPY